MKAAGSRALSAASSGARSALGSAAPWAWSRACSARLIIVGLIHGARTNQVRRASPAASHVVSNVFPPARVNPALLHLGRKIRQPLKRRRSHGQLSLLPPRRRSSHWSEHSHLRSHGMPILPTVYFFSMAHSVSFATFWVI